MSRRTDDFLIHGIIPTVLGVALSVGVVGLGLLLAVLSTTCGNVRCPLHQNSCSASRNKDLDTVDRILTAWRLK